jgi:hypothetical protein
LSLIRQMRLKGFDGLAIYIGAVMEADAADCSLDISLQGAVAVVAWADGFSRPIKQRGLWFTKHAQ